MIGVSSAILPTPENPIVYLTKGMDFSEADYTAFASDDATYAIGEGQGGEAVLGERAYIYLLDETDEIRVMKETAKGGVFTLAAATFVAQDEKSSFTGWQRVEKQNDETYRISGEGKLLNPGEKMKVDSDRIYLRAVFGDGIISSETKFRNTGKVVKIDQLTGSMALQAHERICPAHATAIINNPYKRTSATDNFHANHRSTGVDTVLYQFFDYRSRSYHYLTGLNLVGNRIWQLKNLVSH